MSDDADNAQLVIDIFEQAKIQSIRNSMHALGTEYCERCGMDIEPERRVIVPWAKTCITCQGLIEHRAKVGIR